MNIACLITLDDCFDRGLGGLTCPQGVSCAREGKYLIFGANIFEYFKKSLEIYWVD